MILGSGSEQILGCDLWVYVKVNALYELCKCGLTSTWGSQTHYSVIQINLT